MKNQKFISKKRKKNFKIDKSLNYKNHKNIFISKNSELFEGNQPIITQEIENFDTYNNSNFGEGKKSSKNKRQDSVVISKLVLNYIKKNKVTTENEVTEYIKNTLKPKRGNKYTLKFIQNRVNDSIDVMSAIGLLKKNKQEIQYIGNNIIENNNNNDNNKVIIMNKSWEKNFGLEEDDIENKSYNSEENDKNKLKEDEYIKKSKELKERQMVLIKKYLTFKFREKFSMVSKHTKKTKKDNLKFPFDIIKYNKSFPIKIKTKEDLSNYLILSNSEFKHFNSYDLIKRVMAPEILPKLNNSNNTNINSDNFSINSELTKDNSKKMISGDSISDNIINNKNNENNQILKKPKENYNINKDNETDEIFNYLKNLKLFRDELTFEDNNKNA